MHPEKFIQLNLGNDEIIKEALLMMIGLNDSYTKEHSIMVADLATRIGEKLNMPRSELERMKMAGYLHDVGKQAVPKILLSKPGKLSSPEFALIKTHVEIGVDMLRYLKVSSDVIRLVEEHHERLDGSGYPRGLRGDEISLAGQVLGVADVISALISKRTYRTAATPGDVKKILLPLTPHKMNPEIVFAALSCIQSDTDEIYSITENRQDHHHSTLQYH